MQAGLKEWLVDPKDNEEKESTGAHTDVIIKGLDIEMHTAVEGVRRGERAQENEAHRRQVEGLETWSFLHQAVDVGCEEVVEI